jgi:hypothetical protein
MTEQTARAEAIEAVATVMDIAIRLGHIDRRDIADMVDAAEPIIRANERAAALEFCCEDNRERLRAQVEALRNVYERRTALHRGQAYVLPEPARTYDERTIQAVLNLLDGGA